MKEKDLFGFFNPSFNGLEAVITIQRKENLEILIAPESSLEYMHILENSGKGTGEGSINGMLIDSEDGRYTPPSSWIHPRTRIFG